MMHQPGIEPGSHRWQRCILPLETGADEYQLIVNVNSICKHHPGDQTHFNHNTIFLPLLALNWAPRHPVSWADKMARWWGSICLFVSGIIVKPWWYNDPRWWPYKKSKFLFTLGLMASMQDTPLSNGSSNPLGNITNWAFGQWRSSNFIRPVVQPRYVFYNKVLTGTENMGWPEPKSADL